MSNPLWIYVRRISLFSRYAKKIFCNNSYFLSGIENKDTISEIWDKADYGLSVMIHEMYITIEYYSGIRDDWIFRCPVKGKGRN